MSASRISPPPACSRSLLVENGSRAKTLLFDSEGVPPPPVVRLSVTRPLVVVSERSGIHRVSPCSWGIADRDLPLRPPAARTESALSQEARELWIPTHDNRD